MKKEKGMAYCGLACCICSENESCAGCRNDGCQNKEWCKSFNCCKEKGLNGCWECAELESCDNFMLKKQKVLSFAKFIAQYGEEKLMSCLEENEKNGVVYHYDGQIIGDYDNLKSEQEVFKLILDGRKDY